MRWRASCAGSRSATLRSSATPTSRLSNRSRQEMKRIAEVISLFIALLAVSTAAFAQAYPNRAASRAGGVVGEELAHRRAQPFAAATRPGAGGSIGTDAGAKGAPDGYT